MYSRDESILLFTEGGNLETFYYRLIKRNWFLEEKKLNVSISYWLCYFIVFYVFIEKRFRGNSFNVSGFVSDMVEEILGYRKMEGGR